MKTALITGASTGFGKNVALRLARDGWRVFASMRDTAKGEDLVLDPGMGSEGSIELIALDVTSPASIDRAIERVLEGSDGKIDALLNNAGFSLLGAFEDLTDALCRQQMETNFFGTLAVTRAVLPAMREARQGRIVTVTSNAVNSPHPLLSLYAASKWALEGWAEGLAMELAPFGIDVAVIQPGAHQTSFASNVVPVLPEGSAYAGWVKTAMPGIGKLDAWSRPAELATDPIVALLTGPTPRFRTYLGEDTEVFAALKGAFPFELRAAVLRAIVGLPAPGAFTSEANGEQDISAVTEVLLSAVGQSEELRRTIAAALAEGLRPA